MVLSQTMGFHVKSRRLWGLYPAKLGSPVYRSRRETQSKRSRNQKNVASDFSNPTKNIGLPR